MGNAMSFVLSPARYFFAPSGGTGKADVTHETPHHWNEFEIVARPENAAHARDRVRAEAQTAGFDGLALADIEIAVGEAVTNAILYGSPTGASPVTVSTAFQPSDDTFHVRVRDRGQGFNPDALRQSDDDTDALGGRGLRLMRALMDTVLLRYDGDGMTVHLTKSRH